MGELIFGVLQYNKIISESFLSSLAKQNAFQLPVSFSFAELFRKSENSQQTNNLQTVEELTKFSYLLLQKEIFLVYSSFEHAVAKGNSPETT